MSAKFSRSVSPRVSQRPFGQCAAFAGEQPRAPISARLLSVIATPRQFSSLQCWHFGDLTENGKSGQNRFQLVAAMILIARPRCNL
jgi:hypothetical protein